MVPLPEGAMGCELILPREQEKANGIKTEINTCLVPAVPA